MSRDEILKLEANKKTDALISQFMEPKPANVTVRDLRCQHRDWIYSDYRVQSPGGWWEAQIGTDVNIGPSGNFVKEFDNNFAEWKPAKKPSREIEAAWEVWEMLVEMERYPTLSCGPTECFDEPVHFISLVNPVLEFIQADTAPLAICRVFLLAVTNDGSAPC